MVFLIKYGFSIPQKKDLDGFDWENAVYAYFQLHFITKMSTHSNDRFVIYVCEK